MNKPLKNRDKRIALLLIAAFAWLFIGSLVIFHEEHVLRKHFNLDFQVFITPKSKDKQGYTGKLLLKVQKLTDSGNPAGILSSDVYSAFDRFTCDVSLVESSSSHAFDIILDNFPLRAPPTV